MTKKIIPILFLFILISSIVMVSTSYARVYIAEEVPNSTIYKLHITDDYNNITTVDINNSYGIDDICSSIDGKYVYLLSNGLLDSYFYASKDGGNTYEVTHFSQYKTNLACSKDGRYVYIGSQSLPISGSVIYKSLNYGDTFTPLTINSSSTYASYVATSYGGDVILTTLTYPNQVYYLTNYGANNVKLYFDSVFNSIVRSVDVSVNDIAYIHYSPPQGDTQLHGVIQKVNLSEGILYTYDKGYYSEFFFTALDHSYTKLHSINDTSIVYSFRATSGLYHAQLAEFNTSGTSLVPLYSTDFIDDTNRVERPINIAGKYNSLIYALNNDVYDQYTTQLMNFTHNVTALYDNSINLVSGYTGIPICLNDKEFCANPIRLLSGKISCYVNDTQYCNGGCSDSTGVAICSNILPNTCNIVGSRICIDSTSYAVCSDSNNDLALDYGEVHPCGLGNFCVGNFNYADCEAIPSQALYNQSLPYVTPYAVSDDLTSYSIDASSRTVSVVTSNLVHSQKFYTTTSLNTNQTFISRTCDYTEQSAFEIVSPVIDKKPYVYDLTSPINTNAYIRIDLIPSNQDPVDISLTDTIGSSVGDIRLIRNTTQKTLCVQYLNGTNIYCDYSTNTYDDLKNVIVTFSYDAVSKTYSNRFDINRAISYKFITYPAYYAGNDIAHISIDSNNVTVNKISGVTTADHAPFENLRLNDLNQSPCVYTKPGSYKVRTFSSTRGYPEYTIYTDYNVNVKTLGAPSGEVAKDQGTANFLNPSNYSIGTRYFLVFLAIVIIIGAFVTMGVQVGHGEMVKAFSMTGMLLGAFIVLIAAITGWIDGWVAFALVMVCLALIIFMGFIGNNKG